MIYCEFVNTIFSGLIEKLDTPTKSHELINSSVLHSILGNALHSNMTSNGKNIDNASFVVTDVPSEYDGNFCTLTTCYIKKVATAREKHGEFRRVSQHMGEAKANHDALSDTHKVKDIKSK